MSERLTLGEMRWFVLSELDDEWCTPTELHARLGLSGKDWYRVALTLERLANDGLAELKTPGGAVRRFRRHREPSS